ncbi:hypothetical protein PybrP1_011609 [[Pythium] brassicae (nom. inval.)]|nr:hypothetical protein PybrP1_011609 [[Pythium] brassicae (nom. inval.)]
MLGMQEGPLGPRLPDRQRTTEGRCAATSDGEQSRVPRADGSDAASSVLARRVSCGHDQRCARGAILPRHGLGQQHHLEADRVRVNGAWFEGGTQVSAGTSDDPSRWRGADRVSGQRTSFCWTAERCKTSSSTSTAYSSDWLAGTTSVKLSMMISNTMTSLLALTDRWKKSFRV